MYIPFLVCSRKRSDVSNREMRPGYVYRVMDGGEDPRIWICKKGLILSIFSIFKVWP